MNRNQGYTTTVFITSDMQKYTEVSRKAEM